MLPVTPPPMHGINVYYENARCFICNRNANYLAILGVCVAAAGIILLIIFGRCVLHPHYCTGIHYQKDIIIGCVCIVIGIVSCFFLFEKSHIIVSDDMIEFWKKGKLIRTFPKDPAQIEVVVELGIENSRNHTHLYNVFFKECDGKETRIFRDLYENTA
ncbi:MAG: hypothetical protein J6A01_07215, partial [Proteobacteria bacterium]|nr:hypothetical protein [Pseudomonadota bacterium]